MMSNLYYAAATFSIGVAVANLFSARRQPSAFHGLTWATSGIGWAVVSLAFTALAYVGK